MIGSRLRGLRTERNMTQEELGALLGVGKTTVSQYESESRKPDTDMLKRISGVFFVSVDFLLGITEAPSYAQGTTSALPILGTIHAGLPILAEENWDGEADAPAEWRGDFALHVAGDSMSWAGIHDGDTAILRQIEVAQHGMIVAAGIEGMEWTATLKFFIQENGQAYLRAANPAYEDIPVGAGHRIIGQLVGVLKEPPSLQQYKDHLVSKEIADKEWAETIEEAIRIGLDGERVKHMIRLFAQVSKNV